MAVSPVDHAMLAPINRRRSVLSKDAYVTEGPTTADEQRESLKLDTTIPQTARIWNYILGGKDNFAADREVGDQIIESFPEFARDARMSRAFLVRAVRYLAGEAGIRQFLDIGTGLPTANNTHEVAQSVAPDARIVYVDNDPLVLVHARALLTSSPEGMTDYIDADMRDSESILREAGNTLDLSQPVGLMLMGVLGHFESDDEARGIVNRIMDVLPSGSYFGMYDSCDTSEAVREAARIWNISANPKYHLRTPERIAAFFDGLEVVEPGVVMTNAWRPDADTSSVVTDQYCGIGRKP
jgi:hypothetical protein